MIENFKESVLGNQYWSIQKIYIVLDKNEYGNPTIFCAAFGNKDLAESYAKGTCSHLSVIEYDLNPCFEDLKNGYKYFYVMMLKNGKLDRKTIEVPFYYVINSEYYQPEAPRFGHNYMSLCMTVKAKEEQEAISLVNQKRLQLIEENKWGPSFPVYGENNNL